MPCACIILIISQAIMKAAEKHFKCINSRTGYAISYHSLSSDLTPEEIKAELEKKRAQVAIGNSLYLETLYWEEMKDSFETK